MQPMPIYNAHTGLPLFQQNQQPEQEESSSPAIRFLYAAGVLLLMFGSFLPGGYHWNLAGLMLVIFCTIF